MRRDARSSRRNLGQNEAVIAVQTTADQCDAVWTGFVLMRLLLLLLDRPLIIIIIIIETFNVPLITDIISRTTSVHCQIRYE